MTPTNIRAALAAVDSTRLPGAVTDANTFCAGSKFHSPTPLTVRPYDLKGAVNLIVNGERGSNADPDTVWLCSTCNDNLGVLVLVVHANKGSLPWEVRREFGNRIRALAYRAWAHYVQGADLSQSA